MSLLPFGARRGAPSFRLGGERSALRRATACLLQGPPFVFAAAPNNPLLVEALAPESAAQHIEAWAGLVSRSLEPNVFSEPSFGLTAAHHFPPSQRPIFVMVWAVESSGHHRLVAVCPLVWSRNPLSPTVSVWFHDLCTLGAPLLDPHYAGHAMQAVLAWVAGRLPGCGTLLVRALPVDGETARVLGDMAEATGRPLHWLDRRERAVLKRDGASEAAGLGALSPKRAKELGRQQRRLAERGDLQYASVHSGEPLREAVEQFLLLEAKGWKGERGTALLMDASRTAFTRTMTRLLAREGKCRVDSLTLDGAPVASGIILSSGGRDFFWKMAYAEQHASLSPGVQFVLALTQAQRQDASVAETDSCAIPDHPMIDRLWPDRLAIVDVAVAVRPGGSLRFTLDVAAERSRRRAKILAKRMIGALGTVRRGLAGRGPK